MTWKLVEENFPTHHAWDRFLLGSRLGQFQQSCRWGQVKSAEGWNVGRLLLYDDDVLAAGAQLLWKHSRFGKFAYISKGPVTGSAGLPAVQLVIDGIQEFARKNGIRALILQAPDYDPSGDRVFEESGFLRNRVLEILESTFVCRLDGNFETIFGTYRKVVRNEIRKALKNGVQIEEGTGADLGLFFDLMSETCRRQQVRPNPGSVDILRKIWDIFGRDMLRLTFASVRGERIAGQLCLHFGKRATIWKKGYNYRHNDFNPTKLLQSESIEWSCLHGFEEYDFMSLDKQLAHAILSGNPIDGGSISGRDMFTLGFGGKPLILPKSFLWFPNPVSRSAYRLFLQYAPKRFQKNRDIG